MRYSLIQKIVWAGLALIVVTFLFGPFALRGSAFVYGTDLDSGLTLVTATGTPADVTVVWN